MAYSIDFRKKVLSYCERTGSITEASHVFQISRNTIYGWLKLKEKTGELNHQVKGTKPRKVDRDRLKNYLTDNPDAYLTEIASEFGCLQLPSTMRSKLWATLEKKNHTYYEQDPEKVALFLKNFNRLKHLAPV
ncbi:IS630-Spn1, transposase Orf1 [Streptococcus pneumoniae]|nr:transposase [Streptococcus pneumoniae]CWG20858.1 IS630-Spn1%2C transposase Orf1 [Streptococcus pneumoniae]VSG57359.1 IS630-Spn1, transposase Orf1 [Streptococcus pneumoniae]